MSPGLEMMRCCIRWYAHFSAAEAGESLSAFFDPEEGGGVIMDSLTSIAKRTASLTDL